MTNFEIIYTAPSPVPSMVKISVAAETTNHETNDTIESNLHDNHPPFVSITDSTLVKCHQTIFEKCRNVDLLFPMTVVYYGSIVTRFNLNDERNDGPFFKASFTFMIICSALFLPHLSTQLIIRYTAADNRSHYYYRFSELWQTCAGKARIEDTIGLLTVLTTGCLLLGRVYAGQCTDHMNIWSIQSCNPFADMQSIPNDNVILINSAPIILRCLMRGITTEALITYWVLCVSFTLTASFHVGVYLQLWTILNSTTFICVSIMIERLTSTNSIQGEEIIAASHQRCVKGSESSELNSANDSLLKQKEVCQLQCVMGNVAHDLKTPLHSIEAGVEILRTLILKMPSTPPNSAPYTCHGSPPDLGYEEFHPEIVFETLTAACEFMRMSINRSQDFMKASNNIALVPSMESFNLSSVLAMSATCLNNLQTNLTIKLHAVDPDICSHVISDKHWLNENTICLLSNALKYSDGGPVDIRVQLVDVAVNTSELSSPESRFEEEISYGVNATTRPGPSRSHICDSVFLTVAPLDRRTSNNSPDDTKKMKQMIYISIEDCGSGVLKEDRNDIFRPLGQAQRSTGGTGLGLFSLSERIAALGGRVGVADRSDGGHGSKFWFTFPYLPDVAAAANVLSEHAVRRTKTTNENSLAVITKSMEVRRILVVDDSLTILKVMSQLLKVNGHTTRTATNGSIGLKMLIEAYQCGDYDVALTDLQMPIMDGMECTRLYRQYEETEMKRELLESKEMTVKKRKRLLIIGMSANSDGDVRRAALESGMDFFIAKPFSYQDLKAILDGSSTKE